MTRHRKPPRLPTLDRSKPLWFTLAWRLLACASIGYLAWRAIGPVGLLTTAPLFGVALASPLMRLIAGISLRLHQRALAPMSGRYFEHRGHPFLIDADDEGRCWLDVDELRQAGIDLPKRAVLLARFAADEVAPGLDREGLRIRADALLRGLKGSSSPDTHRFSLWLERMVMAPAQKAHQTRFSRRY